MMTRIECGRWLQEHDNYVILTHRRPDGDTIGSAAVLCRMLRNMRKKAAVLENPEVTQKFSGLLEGLTTREAGPEDTVVSVDVATASLLPENARKCMGRIALKIDHHDSADAFAEKELVDPSAGACAEIIFDVMEILGLHMSKASSEAMYTAISTDTGCFCYANTTAHTFRVAAACAEAGGDLFPIAQQLFDTTTYARLKMKSWIVENITFFCGGKIALCAIPGCVEQELGVSEDDMENISGFPRSIEGVCMAATLRQLESGIVKVSVRAVPGWNAAAICKQFGGGGHRGAAGSRLAMPMEDAARLVAKTMVQWEKSR